MTNEIRFGRETSAISKYLSKEMPALNFIIWDLHPFISILHNWRKNIIFLECDRVAIDSLTERLGSEYPKYDIYSGIKKPVIKINRESSEGSIVITAREGTKRRETEGNSPKIEKCLVDLLYYSINETLPISSFDILDLWTFYLVHTDSVRFKELYRYSTRRYLGWFVSIFAYELSKKNEVKIDGRNIRRGMKNMELISKVEQLG